jgi:hypothetical protein
MGREVITLISNHAALLRIYRVEFMSTCIFSIAFPLMEGTRAYIHTT